MNSFKLSVSKPCSENWNSFTKSEGKGYCSSCQKNVIDFTRYSDKDIIAFFKEHGKEKTCGRFLPHQLKEYSLNEKKREFRAAAALITAGILSISNPTESNATPRVNYETVVSIDDPIKGRVIAVEDSSHLPGALVAIKGTNQHTTTDADGNFSLDYKGNEDKITLVVNFIGMQTQEVEINLSKQTEINLSLGPDVRTLGDVIYIGPLPQRIWWRIKSLFTRN